MKKEITPEEALAIVLRMREYQRKYNQRPEVREKRKKYQNEYIKRPNVCELRKQYQKKHYAALKEKLAEFRKWKASQK